MRTDNNEYFLEFFNIEKDTIDSLLEEEEVIEKTYQDEESFIVKIYMDLKDEKSKRSILRLLRKYEDNIPSFTQMLIE